MNGKAKLSFRSATRLSLGLSLGLFLVQPAFALDPINRPYQSMRSAAMGGVRMTTGLYDENFFNNPARITANPRSKFTLLQLGAETSNSTISSLSAISSPNPLTALVNTAGKNLHARVQLIFPAYYSAATEGSKFAFGIGLITGFQLNSIIQQSYQASVLGLADVGPAITLGRKFLDDDALSVGITGHYMYRVSTDPNYSLLDYFRGITPSINSLGGSGSLIDFDIGGTYQVTEWGDFKIGVAAAMQNLLGGTYIKNSLLPGNGMPLAQPRSIGLGVSAVRPDWSYFTNTTFAFEITDLMNNARGSLFRMIHLGGETHWKSFAFRLGLNQGYWTAGIGFDVHYLNLDLTTYGEELGLNSGTQEDRRYALNLGFHI